MSSSSDRSTYEQQRTKTTAGTKYLSRLVLVVSCWRWYLCRLHDEARQGGMGRQAPWVRPGQRASTASTIQQEGLLWEAEMSPSWRHRHIPCRPWEFITAVQEPGMTTGKSYVGSTVPRPKQFGMVLAIACEHGWPVWQLNVQVTCLQSKIEGRDVYVKTAPGQDVKDSKTGEPMVYKPKRSLRGLAQSSVR